MYRLERTDFVQSPYISLWAILGFQAGFLNAFGFLAFGRYVSHVTGFGTQIGISLAENKWAFAAELMAFPLFFIFGSFFSGMFTIARIERGLKPRYDLITLLLPLLITFLLICALTGSFGPFGEQLLGQRDFVFLFLLTFVCGIQNGCFATMTKGQIRTTHMTGISTDIGSDLSRLCFGKIQGDERVLTKKTNVSRIATFIFFALGSILSVICSSHLQYWALVVPVFTAFGIYFAVKRIGRILDVRFRVEKRSRERLTKYLVQQTV